MKFVFQCLLSGPNTVVDVVLMLVDVMSMLVGVISMLVDAMSMLWCVNIICPCCSVYYVHVILSMSCHDPSTVAISIIKQTLLVMCTKRAEGF